MTTLKKQTCARMPWVATKINFENEENFPRRLKRVFSPRSTINPPQFHHQKTTFCTPLFAKTPAKTPLHQPAFFSPVTIRKPT
jgi:hypothetical protein